MGNKLVEGISALVSRSHKLTPDIYVLDFAIVNACIVKVPESGTDKWVLVDTGLENSANFILEKTNELFGEGSRPQAIILTHGHFDHVGSVIKLSELWDVPVYIHELELPYVTGKKDYPVGDPSVDEGMVAKMSPSFPHTRIDISSKAKALPDDGSVPGMPGWRWIYTPGHTEGHVSLFHENDRTLIVGDAFTTTKQESFVSVLTHIEQISGPPKYLTTDWNAAKDSVALLKSMNPTLAIPSHGEAMKGDKLNKHLEKLVNEFDKIAKPRQGRFV